MTDRPIKRAGNGKGKGKGSGGDPAKGDARQGGNDPAGASPPDYGVGYGRPPLHTRFQKGQPRPPRKPKPDAEDSFEDYFAEELRLPMRFVDETGKEQVYPKGKVLAKTSVNKAVKSGDLRQIKEFIPRRKASEGNEISQTDLAMVARFFANWLPGGLADLEQLIGAENQGAADVGDNTGEDTNAGEGS